MNDTQNTPIPFLEALRRIEALTTKIQRERLAAFETVEEDLCRDPGSPPCPGRTGRRAAQRDRLNHIPRTFSNRNRIGRGTEQPMMSCFGTARDFTT